MAAISRIAKKHGVKLTILILLFWWVAYLFGSSPKYLGYAPDQPIDFSHKIHAGELQIDCLYCHNGAEKSAQATIPDQGTCIKCHEFVANDSKPIQYLRQSYQQGVPLRWLKAYDLPDHVRFNHKVHVAKGFDCTECHGDVKNMAKIEVAVAMNMGWCIDCHRRNTPQKELPGHNRSVQITECGTCHY